MIFSKATGEDVAETQMWRGMAPTFYVMLNPMKIQLGTAVFGHSKESLYSTALEFQVFRVVW